jgi:hypothetical protein
MTDELIDGLVAGAAAYDDTAVLAIDLHGAEQALLEEIMSTCVSGQAAEQSVPTHPAVAEAQTPQPTAWPDRPPSGRNRRPAHGRLVAVLAALAVAAVLAGAMVLPSLVSPDDLTGGHSGTDRTSQPFSAAARQVAGANPRLLVDAPGWRVTHVEQFDPTDGEVRFSNGQRQLQVNWRPAQQHREYVADRRDVSTSRPVPVLGATGLMFTYSPRDFTVIAPVRGRVFLELRGGVGDRAAFLRVLGRLEPVDVDTWLAAMPASVVRPAEEAEVADEMLADVPIPVGFDTSTLPSGGSNDYYQYGARVSGLLTCAWIEDWKQARAQGDGTELRLAADALSSTHRWRVLKRMDAAGDYPEVVWEIADQVAAGTLPDEYRQGLGCP